MLNDYLLPDENVLQNSGHYKVKLILLVYP